MTSPSPHAAEPELFEPEPVEAAISNSVDDDHRIGANSQFQIAKASFANRSSSPLSPPSPQFAPTSTGKENKDAGGKEKNSNSGSPAGSVDLGASAGFKRSPPFLVGSGGSLAKRPSVANRLSVVDRNWLERCQVFGEMEAEEIPGGGNQEIKVKKRQEKEVKGGKAEGDLEGERKESVDLGQEEKLADPDPNCAQEDSGKSKREKAGKTERGKSSHLPDDNSEDGLKSKGTKKKRQRDGDDVEETVKKRRKNPKKKEERLSLSPDSTDGGEKKKQKSKRKNGDEEETTKGAKTVFI